MNIKFRMIYQVAVGPKSKLYEHCIDSVAKYCKKYGIEHIVQREPILRICPDIFATNRSTESYKKHGGFLPIYEKENAFDYFDRFNDIAIIDADIYIRPDAPNIFEHFDSSAYDFGAAVERDMPITPEYAQKIQNYSRMQYSNLKDVEWHWNSLGAKFYNMGMIVMNESIVKHFKGQNAREFLNRVEFKRFIDGDGAWKWSTDQTLLNWWVKKVPLQLQEMEWKFNALYKGVTDESIVDAYFVHFFLKDKLPDQGEDVDTLMSQI